MARKHTAIMFAAITLVAGCNAGQVGDAAVLAVAVR